jgi:exosome complex RNA-binding protein Rrp42 (RNase PH superfamily)
MVVVQAEEKPQRLLLKSIPCSFLFAVLNRDIFMLSPDLHEKKACNGAFIRIILDLVTGSLLEIDKGQVCVPDNLLLSEILPIAKNSAAKLKYLLE